jgi:hypothetical protein
MVAVVVDIITISWEDQADAVAVLQLINFAQAMVVKEMLGYIKCLKATMVDIVNRKQFLVVLVAVEQALLVIPI